MTLLIKSAFVLDSLMSPSRFRRAFPMNGMRILGLSMIPAIGFALICCSANATERSRTEEALGVVVEEFPTGQGPAGFDELPGNAPQAAFAVEERPVSGPSPQDYYEGIPIVRAKGPDGSEYEADCGYSDSLGIAPDFKAGSNADRQSYGTHHGATYCPESVFIGKREGDFLYPKLVFPDVGSHTTAPHAFSIDSEGSCHLAVADVNIFQENRLKLYWVTGDLQTGKWTKAWLIEQRGFTSWAHPRSVALGKSVHLLWNWVDAGQKEANPANGLFHIEWTPKGLSRKVHIAAGEIDAWGVTADPDTGILLAIFAREDGVYGTTKRKDSMWSRSSRILPYRTSALSVEIRDGMFLVRTGSDTTREWAIRCL